MRAKKNGSPLPVVKVHQAGLACHYNIATGLGYLILKGIKNARSVRATQYPLEYTLTMQKYNNF
jgi:hypothetical protein